jgi:SAM-dependent methyltransferase
MNYDKIIQDVIEEYKHSPIDILSIGDTEGEYNYLNSHKYSYVRTIRDIDNLWENNKAGKKILEIGSFLGTVSISLKNIGYSIYALDIPEFYQSSSLRSYYKNNGIPYIGLNLKNYQLPFESGYFDAIIICEVMEHFNFNPLPVLKEMNRVLKKDGYIYIGMPNQARIINRIKLLHGKSINNSIDDFFEQLDRNSNMIVGLHWREYTLIETMKMIEKMGFKVTHKYYFVEKENINIIDPLFKKLLLFIKILMKTFIYVNPSFRPYQVVIGKKISVPIYDFWLTEANSDVVANIAKL